MSTFFLFGRYTPEAIKGISASRTKDAHRIVEAHGGTVKSIHALLGENDLVIIVDLPDTESAVKVSLALHRETGIGFKTSPAVDVKDFDELASA